MARHKRDYSGEKFSEPFPRLQITPSQLATLEEGAARAGTTISQYTRELCFRRSGATQIVAGTRRSPEAKIIAEQLFAIGNNLNQLARIANTTKAAPHYHELKMAIDFLKVVLNRVLAP
jgi:hypothetical protein